MNKPPRHVWDASAPPATPNLDYALAYAARGWAVLPVWSVDSEGQCRCGRPNGEHGHNPGKHPHARLAPRGHNDASTDPQTLKDWWAEDPEAGIGLALAESGLLALDIDPRNGGREALEALEAEHGVLHSDCTALTQGGGEHRLFTADPEMSYPGSLGAGLDLKHNGYICVAPTLGPTGEYKWAAGRSPLSKSQPAQPSPLPALISDRARPPADYTLTEKGGVLIATAQTFDDLRSALRHVDPDDYNTWVNVGMALRPYGESGYRVWAEWAARSDKFNAGAARRKWERDLDSAHSITYRSIFRMAMDNGWQNAPSSSAAAAEPLSAHPLSLTRAQDSGASRVALFEYIFEDFMSTGVNVVAGAPGVGKTTLIIPLALAAAHLCPADYVLRPQVRRNVIIITESVVQVQRVIYSLHSWGYTGMTAEQFEQRVRVIPARRMAPELFVQVAAEYAEWTVDNPKADGSVFKALPLIIVDTTNAVYELENENDNAEVGRALALTKQSFADFPVMLIAHSAKINGMMETDFLSPRGASAWTGDAQGVYMVFKDGEGELAPRVLKAVKVRFPVRFTELTFDLVSNREKHLDVLGYEREIWFSHSVARPLAPGERTQLKEDAKDAKEQDDWGRLCDELLELVRRDATRSRSYYERLPVAQGGAKGSQERKERAVTSLLNDGCLVRVELEKPKGRADHYLRVDEATVQAIERGRYNV